MRSAPDNHPSITNLCTCLFIHTVWLALTRYLVIGILIVVFVLQTATGPVGITPARFRSRSS